MRRSDGGELKAGCVIGIRENCRIEWYYTRMLERCPNQVGSDRFMSCSSVECDEVHFGYCAEDYNMLIHLMLKCSLQGTEDADIKRLKLMSAVWGKDKHDHLFVVCVEKKFISDMRAMTIADQQYMFP